MPEGAPGTVLGPASSVPVGGGAVFADQQVVVTQPAAGTFQGLSAVCPHQGCQVNAVRDGAVICPCHGSRFGLDGAVLEGPATTPLARRAVTVNGQNVTLA
ncbi:Rieske (2Fe-2S) protein [Pseudonocardia sp. KRD-291]|nr:Rieske (2Fe-2S) protein [Pseudonocardia sp. KRD291]